MLVHYLISKRNRSAHPFPFFATGGHFIADAFCDNLSFILGKSYQNIQHHSAGTCGRVDFLRDTDEGCSMFIKDLAQFGKIADGS